MFELERTIQRSSALIEFEWSVNKVLLELPVIVQAKTVALKQDSNFSDCLLTVTNFSLNVGFEGC